MPTANSIAVTPETLLASVHDIGPLLRGNTSQGELDRNLPQGSFDAMRDAGLLRLGKPPALGGFEIDAMSMAKLIEELAVYDTAAAWNLQISTAVTMFFCWFSDETAREVLATDPNATLAGTLHPPGKAFPVDGGYRLSGRWSFGSGCKQASWCFGPAFVMDGDSPRVSENGIPEQIVVTFPANEAEIIDTWNTIGMRGTGSHDVAANDLFLPAAHTAPFGPPEQLSPTFDYPLYWMQFWTGLAILAPPALGAARAAIDALVELARNKTPNFTVKTLRDRSVVQSNIALARARLDSARSYFYESLIEADETARAGERLSLDQKAKIQLATSYAVRSAADSIDLVCEAAGTSAVRKEKPFEKWFRDVHTITQHAASSTARYESVGQVMFGLESDWPFFAL